MNAMHRFVLLAELQHIMDTTPSTGHVARSRLRALLGHVPAPKKPKAVSKAPRPVVAKPVKPARKKVYKNKTYDRDVRYARPVEAPHPVKGIIARII